VAVQSKTGRAITVTVLILASLGIIYALINFTSKKDSETAVQVGQPAPNFTLTTLDGSKLSLTDLKGKVVLLNFWVSWCEPCKEEMPAIQQTYEAWKDKGLVVVGVNIAESKVTAKGFAERLGVSFPVVLDSNREVTVHSYNVGPIPSSFFIDKNGIVRSVNTGGMSANYMKNKIETLLAQ
jgi:peroxiredoxin